MSHSARIDLSGCLNELSDVMVGGSLFVATSPNGVLGSRAADLANDAPQDNFCADQGRGFVTDGGVGGFAQRDHDSMRLIAAPGEMFSTSRRLSENDSA